MATATLVVLVLLSALVLVASFGLLVTLGAKQLHTSLGIAHDGLKAGRSAPSIDVVDVVTGGRIVVPTGRRQVLLFTDHSLIDFPDLLALLSAEDPENPEDSAGVARPDIVVLGSASRTAPALLSGLGLRVPTGVVPHDVYGRYRVRVMPYAVIVGADGKVVTSGLVNTPFQIRHLAQVGLETEPAAAS